MILVDANILLYTADESSRFHRRATEWWDTRLSGDEAVCLCWPVISAFIRIGTNPRLFARPMSLREAANQVQSWLEQPCVRIVRATDAHWELFRRCMEEVDAVGNLVSDAHLAALAMEHGCELCSSDADFARFRGLRWNNPLK